MIIFWAECSHHAQSIKPIYNWMVQHGKDVLFQISKRPPKEGNVVTSSAHIAWANGKPLNRLLYLNHSLDRHELAGDYALARQFKAVIFPGVWWQKRMKNPPTNRVVGWPKSDILFHANIQKLRKEIALPEGKTIFYAASYTYQNKKLAFEEVRTLKILAKVAQTFGFNVIVKLHPGIRDEYFNLLTATLKKLPTMYVLPRYSGNSMEMFSLADVFVSETSGMLTEFLATDKSSIQIFETAKHKAPGGVFHVKVGHIGNILRRLHPHPQAATWKKLLMDTVDGKASERASNFVEEVFR